MLYDPDLIITADNRAMVIAWLSTRGEFAASLNLLTNVELVNLYHARGTDASAPAEPNDIRRATSAAIMATLAAMPPGRPGPVDEELIRYLARQEAEKLIDDRLPVTLNVVSERGTITLDGLQHYCTELVIKICALGHAVMLVGPAGCGKTTIGERAAQALTLPFYITSTINDTFQLVGFTDGHGKYHDTPFRNAYERGGVWVADEIDAWDAGALLAANSALANGYCNFPDRPEPIARHADFRMIATANTYGTGADRVYVGRNELDAASLDRFATIDVDYDLELERAFAGKNTKWLDRVWNVRKIVNEKRIRHVVSSRAIMMGGAALSVGVEWSDVEKIYLFKGMSEQDRKKCDV